ncbi:MAG TPA: copper resistance CopC family protein [Candidatus Nanopelagicaceae bacterium]
MNVKHRLPLACLLLLMMMPMTAAQAHTSVVSSNPAIHARLAKLPTHVQIEFDENLLTLGGAKTNVLQVQDAQGKEIDAGNSKVAGPIIGVDIKDQPGKGTFTVSWRVVSSDGHPVEGSYQFSVGQQSQTLAPKTTVPIQKGESFWNRHSQQIYVLILGIIAIGIWVRFDWRRRKVS